MQNSCAAVRDCLQSVIGHGIAAVLCAAMLLAPVVAAVSQREVAAVAAIAAPSKTATHTLLVMGDSLSAAYGLDVSQGWVALTAADMRGSHAAWRVVNASVSGETTAGGAARIKAELARTRPAVVVIELGANDGLRGLPNSVTRANLGHMIEATQAAGARVLLIGMRLPPNYGRAYTTEFAGLYPGLAKQFGTALLPFLLSPIALDRSAYLADNLHPNAAAQPALKSHVWKALEPLLRGKVHTAR